MPVQQRDLLILLTPVLMMQFLIQKKNKNSVMTVQSHFTWLVEKTKKQRRIIFRESTETIMHMEHTDTHHVTSWCRNSTATWHVVWQLSLSSLFFQYFRSTGLPSNANLIKLCINILITITVLRSCAPAVKLNQKHVQHLRMILTEVLLQDIENTSIRMKNKFQCRNKASWSKNWRKVINK